MHVIKVLLWVSLLVTSSHTLSLTLNPAACEPFHNCSAAFQAAFDSCKHQSEPCTVTATPGVFTLHGGRGPRLTAKGVSGLRLLGYGAVLMVDGIGGAFNIIDCADVTIAGFVLDQPRVPFTVGRFVQSSNGSARFTVNSSLYPPPAADQSWLESVQATMEYDASAGRPAVGGLDDYSLDAPQQLRWSGQTVQLLGAAFASRLKPGADYVLRHQVYAFNAIGYRNLTRPAFVDLEILSTPGMGIVGQGGVDVTIRNVRVYKTKGRAMSLTADAVHLTNTRGWVSVTDSLFEGQGDDGINIPSLYNSVLQLHGNHSAALGTRQDNTKVVAPSMSVGDRVEFRSRRTLAGYFNTTVVSVDQSTHRVVFSEELPASLKIFDLVISVSQQPDWILIRNNTFRNNRARGLLLKQHSALVTGNRFLGSSGPAIQADPDGCFWFEGDVVRNWTIRSNQISNNNYGTARQQGDIFISSCVPTWNPDGTPGLDGGPPPNQQPHSDVVVDSNGFYQFSSQAAVSATGVAGLVVTRNQIAWAGSVPPVGGSLIAHDCSGVNATANRCHPSAGANVPCVKSVA